MLFLFENCAVLRLKHLDYVYENIDTGNLVFSIFLDIRKTFDCVDHNILLSKLNIYGVFGIAIDWFKATLRIENNMFK